MSNFSVHVERLEPTSMGWIRYGFQHLQRYTFALAMVRQKRVLDVACGPGYGSYVLAANGALEVIGVDIAEEAVTHAVEHYKAENLSYILGDGQTYVSDRPFDVIVSFETLEHVPQPAAFLKTLEQNLTKDGLLVLSAPNRLKHKDSADRCDNPFHLSEPTYSEAVALLSERFVILQSWEQSPVNADAAFNAEHLYLLQTSLLLRGIIRMESLMRRLLGKPWPARRAGGRLERRTEIMPLLPSRVDEAEVFLFVCRKRQ
jgi:SAM-dependent methyltransferase